MYRYRSIPDNLVAFCSVLRERYGFRVGSGDVAVAARALTVLDVTREQTVRDALRVVFSRTSEQATTFDQAFTEFFYLGSSGEPPDQPPMSRPVRRGVDRKNMSGRRGGREADPFADDKEDRDEATAQVPAPLDGADHGLEEISVSTRARYSPLEVESTEYPAPPVIDAAWMTGARLFVRRIQLGISRRWRPAVRGRRLDARRTFRASVQIGGEPVVPRWRQRDRRTPHFVVLLDGSRSMGPYTDTALKLVTALISVTPRVEAFTFSTALQRVTHELRSDVSHRPPPRQWNQRAWGGGTSIGSCLRTFARRFGNDLLGPDTLIIICSDGLDVGEPEVLRHAMRDLRSRSAGIVWLNPLIATRDYAPTARGMRAALPYVTTFSTVDSAHGLAALARTARVRG